MNPFSSSSLHRDPTACQTNCQSWWWVLKIGGSLRLKQSIRCCFDVIPKGKNAESNHTMMHQKQTVKPQEVNDTDTDIQICERNREKHGTVESQIRCDSKGVTQPK